MKINILYIITILALYILFMLMRKKEKKQNIIKWLVISVIVIICYNIIICLILTLLNCLCTLKNLSICNLIMIVIIVARILKIKKIQQYYCKISELVFSILLLIFVITIAYEQYGFPFNIKYEITDGSSHYFFAQQFYENSTLLYNENTDDNLEIYNSKFRLPGAYINEGILFKVFDNVIAKTDLFIIFDLCVLYMSGILFYYLLNTYSNDNKILNVIAIIFAVIYMLGYQLNSMLYGYVYLSLALDIIITFLLVMENYEKKVENDVVELLILSLISFGIFFSYAYFIPIIYTTIIVNLTVKSLQNKEKILSIKNVTKIIYLIVIPLILGFSYFIIFPLTNGIKTEISTIGVDGEIYKNYISNYLYFIPILMLFIIEIIKSKEKDKESNFSIIIFIISILFAIILFIGNKIGIVSNYYFFKAYYIIWPIYLYNIYVAISYICRKKTKQLKINVYIYIVIYILLIIAGTLGLKKNIKINDIFYNNFECIKSKKYILINDELKLIEKAERLLTNGEMYILTSPRKGRMLWMSVLYHNQYIYIDAITDTRVNIEEWLNEKEQRYYLAYYEEYKKIEENKEFLDEKSAKYKIIYTDEYGFILERK